tara:strand:- start:2045 stop:2743 length:699 start_codon:yes stop_codon:yes gene_type:complete
MFEQKKIYIIIPARGGSKGVPKKNIKKFLGKPLLQHTIDYAKESNYVDEIILSSDDTNIKKIGYNNNINVIDRPLEISGDNATTETAIQHVIDQSNFEDNCILILLQATSPIRPKKSLDKMITLFNNNKYDSMLTLSPIHPLLWKIDNKTLKAQYNYKNRPRRQDFNEKDLFYDENGSVYIFTHQIFKNTSNRLGGKIGFFIFDEKFGKQIDEPLDFHILETIGEYLKKGEK